MSKRRFTQNYASGVEEEDTRLNVFYCLHCGSFSLILGMHIPLLLFLSFIISAPSCLPRLAHPLTLLTPLTPLTPLTHFIAPPSPSSFIPSYLSFIHMIPLISTLDKHTCVE